MVIMRRVARNMAERRAEWFSVFGRALGLKGQPENPPPLKQRYMISGARSRDIKRLKKLLVIRRTLFWRLCNEVMLDLGFKDFRISRDGSDAIQEFTEGNLALYFGFMNDYAAWAGRETVLRKDLRFFGARIQNPSIKAPWHKDFEGYYT